MRSPTAKWLKESHAGQIQIGDTAELAPAYDIVFTPAYISDEQQFALNLNKTKSWYDIDLSHFESWSERIGVPWRAIEPHPADVIDKARGLWQQRRR